jgi:hypothetical protein
MELHVSLPVASWLAIGVWGGTAGDDSLLGSLLVGLKHIIQAIGVWGGTAGE